ncbi:MAG: PAS domain-containing protein [Chloroflexi bacterium]|nr:MAG: PAS domain-containing protein [Chloroflexota bacterium]
MTDDESARLPATERARLETRIASLEDEAKRAFEDAQREADALFAQYQLSQLVASGGSLAELAGAVLLELTRLAAGDEGAVWLGDRPGGSLELAAEIGSIDDVPARLMDPAAARAWAAGRADLRVVVLADEPSPMFVAIRAADGRALDEDGIRVAQLARHELSVAFAGARLREALEREGHDLAAIVDGATDVIVQVDESCRITRLNPAAQRLLGLTNADALGRTCGDALGCEAAGGHRVANCPLAETIRTGVPIGYRETAIRGTQGTVKAGGGYSPGLSRQGGVRATAILRDLSATEALDQLREGFVATVSHELRTPIALIRGYAETLLEFDLEPEQQREYLERIQGLTTRLGDLTSQILDATHLDADPLILERTPVSFASLVARLRGDLALTGGDDRLVTALPPGLPPIEVDPSRVGRILENLVGNALKYAPDGSPVTIGAEVADGWLAVHVDDEGIGVPEADRPLVAEPFHRAWNVRESRIPGTGLGLYICRRLVEAHGGSLTIGDRPDGRPGTRVRFTLPILGGRRDRQPSPENGQQPVVPEGVGG